MYRLRLPGKETPQNPGRLPDKSFVSRLFTDALQVFETAAAGATENLGILVDDSGALRIVQADGWRPDALQEHYGARSVFQVTHTPAGLRVDARSGAYSCTLAKDGQPGLGALGLLA